MTIENRVAGVDLNNDKIDTDYRAALHRKISKAEIDLQAIRRLIHGDFGQPLSGEAALVLHNIGNILFEKRGGREMIYLSALSPFGLDSILARTSPLKVAHVTGRTADVVADPTTQLATEVYRRRSQGNKNGIKLGAVHKCVRLQRYTDKNYLTSFEMFGTADSILRHTNNRSPEISILRNLIDYYLNAIGEISPGSNLEVCVGNVGIANKILPESSSSLSSAELETQGKFLTESFADNLQGRLPQKIINLPETQKQAGGLNIGGELLTIERVLTSLPPKPNVTYTFQLDRLYGRGHYSGQVFTIFVGDVDFIDGGVVDWVARLSSNLKETTVVSGFGTELFARQLVRTGTP
ncbi:hypothetical protein A3D84_02975 [Candidatus Woesebacteria bacterium RIFCSPHIGHO2_02_FULL_42_20]|uniref:Uncharacterized protein n=1 Tax=Candidatus Woesebacteria bacterium RIFCSPHIGHO2_12_FULL_41_24 TaxID=1802510 RepID=A0A1F8AT94_9BACT|nr:MAG: hypothetical protein A2W15_03165 [Candidatus Woesebacteria bacterium RBG_16_41_13]OGM30542.1 MAG: hypothetical protein A2873_05475 [Candidatus Woesebacteria bacterium RIFCSPHIGHO2_01_FULL_42_80]OGM34806.1 MAG: hypothetical protein A3D84_02975 [Candidatus Woesebacteria bacterium RIFCSPHIGHO2_02_FULL_42_20]OGM54435.1 MAG: hypothetical protein A3E44_00010 [Candidatus Woesebacteria bacterium RIFCSPHIGHO2_12_FULL_41_24]OGM68055.1 MAG: hypothetical protein A2969_05095 [Candidatus Woesebacteri